MKRRITVILNELNIKPNYKGYEFLREAILMAVADWTVIHEMTKRLYPEVAQKCGSTGTRVERGIRYVIGQASELTLRKYFHGNVTNGEFIATIADRLRLEQEEKGV